MRFAIVVFPGTLNDGDCYHVLHSILDQEVQYVWHQEKDLDGYDCVVLPGGFSYGDYLRAGSIARFSPIMAAVERFGREGKLVIGICNGFQILCEAGLLPGALMRNQRLRFLCQWVSLRVENPITPFTSACHPDQTLRMPIAHGEGNYFADDQTIQQLEAGNQIVLRYCTPDGIILDEANPNGSKRNIAGIISQEGNIFGLMPHPDRCSEEELGGTDGLHIWKSILRTR